MRILKGLTSRILPCGCFAGVYETYDGDVVELIDTKSSSCSDSSHEAGKRIPVLEPARQSSHG